MKKINLRGISEILSEKELKNVMGGSGACRGCASGEKCVGGREIRNCSIGGPSNRCGCW